MLSLPPSFDLDFSHAIQHYQPSWLTLTMKFVSALVTPEVIMTAGLALVVYLHFRKHDDRLIQSMFFISTGYLLIPVLKSLFDRPRPNQSLVQVLAQASDSSMPSGHALGVVLLGGMVAVLIGRMAHHHRTLLLAIVAFVILLVGYSRIYLGVHWLSDVLVGYVIGLLWVMVALRIRYRTRKEVST